MGRIHEPEISEPEEPERTGNFEFTDYNYTKSNEMLEVEKEKCKNKGFQFVSPRNCETVGPKKIPPYGGANALPVLAGKALHPNPSGSQKAVLEVITL